MKNRARQKDGNGVSDLVWMESSTSRQRRKKPKISSQIFSKIQIKSGFFGKINHLKNFFGR
jgi:hypothetical protein